MKKVPCDLLSDHKIESNLSHLSITTNDTIVNGNIPNLPKKIIKFDLKTKFT